MLKRFIDKFEQLVTPFFFYDIDILNKTLDLCKSAADRYGYKLHYAVKANANSKILRIISSKGYGADCVSGNEITRCLATGFAPGHIAFAGVGKSDREIRTGLGAGIFSFNCESAAELKVINEIAGSMNKTANIALRINPNVDANTHQYITTGLEENKFGINMWELSAILEMLPGLCNLKMTGLHFHIGSQIRDLSSYKGLCLRVNQIQKWFYERRIIPEHINLGGGLGVDYERPDENLYLDFESYFAVFNKHLELRPRQTVHFEPGRALLAQCGTLLTRCLYIKEGINTNFAIVDAGMTELIRPALYQAVHRIENLSSEMPRKRYDVVGPICESSDCFAKAIMLPETSRADLIAIRTAGAYGEVMSSGYNLRDKAAAYYSDEI